MTNFPARRAPRSCVFCGARPVTREALIPKWLRKLLKERTGAAFDRTPGRKPWVMSLLTTVRRQVCAACNNGWMSELENEAKPVLTPMLLDETSVLSPRQQVTLAKWAMKFVMVASAGTDTFPTESYERFRNHRLPLRGTAIWTAYYAGGRHALRMYT